MAEIERCEQEGNAAMSRKNLEQLIKQIGVNEEFKAAINNQLDSEETIG